MMFQFVLFQKYCHTSAHCWIKVLGGVPVGRGGRGGRGPAHPPNIAVSVLNIFNLPASLISYLLSDCSDFRFNASGQGWSSGEDYYSHLVSSLTAHCHC